MIKDDQSTLKQSNICNGAKLMVVGSTLKDVLTVRPPSKDKQKESYSSDTGNLQYIIISITLRKKQLVLVLPYALCLSLSFE